MTMYRQVVRVAAVATLALFLLPGCSRQTAEWKVVASPGEAIMSDWSFATQDTTHALAAAWLARYHGVDDPDRTDKQSVIAMSMHISVPACQSCDSPVSAAMDIAGGLEKYFAAKGRPKPKTTQRFVYSEREAERGTFEDYARAIDANQPVVLTWSYLEGTREDTKAAAMRVSWCFSNVGIGYVRNGDAEYVIVHDGLTKPFEDRTDALDRVGPLTAGLGNTKGPWDQPGTSIYRWEGEYQNLTMVFVEP